MRELRWLDAALVVAVHEEQLARFGGRAGLRDAGALDAALARPVRHRLSGAPHLVDAAAALACTLARDRPFTDGNERSAFAAMALFLRLNGVPFRPSPAEATVVMGELAAGAIDETALATWIRAVLRRG